MLTLDVDGERLGITFSHSDKDTLPRSTECKIFKIVGEDAIPLTHGVAKCSLQDNFDKSFGRAVSLFRATEKYDHNKRKAIFETLKKKGVNFKWQTPSSKFPQNGS